ncbi:MAG TPA: nitroreductase family protein [Ktedonobacteraceae bacterium]|nr:nitroreductase family protein [Ktedonobacteraceae bacterium]
MEFTEVVRKRRMIRHFTSEPVAPEVIDRLLELTRHAPSAGFTQGQSFIVVTQPDLKKEIGRLCGEEEYVAGGFHPFVSEAPVLFIPCTSEAAYHRRYQEPDKLREDGTEIEWPVPYWYMDIGCAVMILLLGVVNEGLGAGYAGFPPEGLQELHKLLNIPDEVTPVGVIPIGHSAPDIPSPSLKRGRKADVEYIHREGW